MGTLPTHVAVTCFYLFPSISGGGFCIPQANKARASFFLDYRQFYLLAINTIGQKDAEAQLPSSP
jgi:hypothetical protein